MGVIMADQRTRVRRTVVGDGSRTIGGDNSDIEVYEALAGDCPRLGAHSVGSVAHRAGEAIQFYVAGVLTEAGVIHNQVEVVALGAQSIGAAARAALGAQVRVRKQVGNELTGDWRLAELIPPLHDVREN